MLHDLIYSPFSCCVVRSDVLVFMSCCNVVVLNAMPLLVFLNRLMIFLIFGLWYMNVVQIFLSFSFICVHLVLCCICWLSFWSRP